MFAAAPPAVDPKKRKTAGPDNEEKIEKASHKMMWSLDTRVRQMEGQVPSYFLTEGETLLVPALEQANKNWEAKLQKGAAHPDGPRRTTLAAGVLNALSKADLSRADQEAQQEIQFYNNMAAMTKSPTVEEQQQILITLLQSYTTAQRMEPEVTVCSFFSTEKARCRRKKEILFLDSIFPHVPSQAHC